MTVHSTDTTMVSDITPERAHRDPRADIWYLSWLPGRPLTREQARTGLEIDELLSDPERVEDPAVHAAVDAGAALIGLPTEQVLILLSTRILARMASEFEREEPRRESAPAVTGRERRNRPLRRHVIEPPRVFG